MATATYSKAVNTSPYYSIQLRRFGVFAIVTLLALIVAIAYLLPFGDMTLLAIKAEDQVVTSTEAPVLPLEPSYVTYEGKTYPLYNVPTEDGVRQWALINKGRRSSEFYDPANPDAGLIAWEGNWRG